jgi:hypothetical protein
MIIVPCAFTIWRGQPWSCACAVLIETKSSKQAASIIFTERSPDICVFCWFKRCSGYFRLMLTPNNTPDVTMSTKPRLVV